jgi:hypothetical protein
MISYTTRFLHLANLIRNLHTLKASGPEQLVLKQIPNLRRRLLLIRNMQAQTRAAAAAEVRASYRGALYDLAEDPLVRMNSSAPKFSSKNYKPTLFKKDSPAIKSTLTTNTHRLRRCRLTPSIAEVTSLRLCVPTFFKRLAQSCFAVSLSFMIASLVLSLMEIWISVDAVNLQLNGIQGGR